MDIYAEITNRIISEMETGVILWQKPWVASGGCVSYATGKPYSLLNQMLLGRPGEYATYQQVQAAGGYVRRGEKAHMVVFWKFLQKEDEETGEVKEIPFLRYYNVFHIDQCEGLKAKHSKPLPQSAEADQKAEAIICGYLKSSGVRMTHQQGDRAFYRPSDDTITLPLVQTNLQSKIESAFAPPVIRSICCTKGRPLKPLPQPGQTQIRTLKRA